MLPTEIDQGLTCPACGCLCAIRCAGRILEDFEVTP